MKKLTIFAGALAITITGCKQSKELDPTLGLFALKTIESGVIKSKNSFGMSLSNGKSYSVSGTTTVYGDDDSDEDTSTLTEGMYVEVETDMIGLAYEIEHHSAVEGPISSIGTDSFVSLHQTIYVDSNTIFDGGITSLADLNVNDMVEVDGARNADGSIQASKIEYTGESYTSGMEVQVYGPISNLDEGNQTFVIGGLTVDYSNASIEGEGKLANGEEVEVEAQVLPSGGVMSADEIEFEDIDDDISDDDADHS